MELMWRAHDLFREQIGFDLATKYLKEKFLGQTPWTEALDSSPRLMRFTHMCWKLMIHQALFLFPGNSENHNTGK